MRHPPLQGLAGQGTSKEAAGTKSKMPPRPSSTHKHLGRHPSSCHPSSAGSQPAMSSHRGDEDHAHSLHQLPTAHQSLGHGAHQHPPALPCVGHLLSQPPTPLSRLWTSRQQKGKQDSINSDKAGGMCGEETLLCTRNDSAQ